MTQFLQAGPSTNHHTHQPYHPDCLHFQGRGRKQQVDAKPCVYVPILFEIGRKLLNLNQSILLEACFCKPNPEPTYRYHLSGRNCVAFQGRRLEPHARAKPCVYVPKQGPGSESGWINMVQPLGIKARPHQPQTGRCPDEPFPHPRRSMGSYSVVTENRIYCSPIVISLCSSDTEAHGVCLRSS